ncbi:hypothetical protein MTBBW1_440003 [Desulfamplus magnetovallimortis]|uniref:Protein kinase domain-containing protein n=1 Tax=Desulfamplus magnetovallimortis TaxID=1246637 RepID=A0A1W1HHE7_9BACT|nr:hypothetical protein [Desulfamplus magnetovallimortis]SLM31798.1 hypothetical protein MTBBW1_440003 [Desulfamplus magnetovallimortis]
MVEKQFNNYLPNKEIFKDYLLKDFVGKGRHATVYLVENRIRKRALKVFDVKTSISGTNCSVDANSLPQKKILELIYQKNCFRIISETFTLHTWLI